MTPKVSVIISTFNRSEKLKRAIDSVLNQTFQDFEIIVVDDCSKDDTKVVVEAYTASQPQKIRYFKLPKNFGNDTRPKNIGAKEAKSDYLAYLDDDNEYRPDHLAVLVKALDSDPDIDMVYGDRYVIDEDGRIPSRIGISMDFNPSMLLQRNYIDTSDVLIRKHAIFYVGGWDERYKKYVDWNLWLRMAKAGFKFKRIPIIISNYYLHQNMKSVTVKDRLKDGSPSVPLGSAPVIQPEWDAFDVEIRLPFLGEIAPPKVAVFTLTYDRLNYTKEAFKSLHDTAGYSFDHFVIDNGSKDGSQKWLEEEVKAGRIKEIILNDDNKGISIASNQALNLIGENYDIILKFDNDAICQTEGWLKKMVEIWESNHMIALSCYIQGLKDNPGGAPRITYGQIRGELVGMTKHLGGICHFVSSKAYKGFRWPEDEYLHGVQDLELSQHLIFNGYQMAYLENYYISHGPTGTEAQRKDYEHYFRRRINEKTARYEKN